MSRADGTPLPVPNPNTRPDAFRDPEVLADLYERRAWRRTDIADHFDVSEQEVKNELARHDLDRGEPASVQPTGNSLARELWEQGLEEAKERATKRDDEAGAGVVPDA